MWSSLCATLNTTCKYLLPTVTVLFCVTSSFLLVATLLERNCTMTIHASTCDMCIMQRKLVMQAIISVLDLESVVVIMFVYLLFDPMVIIVVNPANINDHAKYSCLLAFDSLFELEHGLPEKDVPFQKVE